MSRSGFIAGAARREPRPPRTATQVRWRNNIVAPLEPDRAIGADQVRPVIIDAAVAAFRKLVEAIAEPNDDIVTELPTQPGQH